MIKIACCQYQIELLSNWDSYKNKIEKWVMGAKEKKANILLMPEYAGIEAICQQFDSDQELYAALQLIIQQYLEFYQDLSVKHQIYIQPGTIIEEIALNQYANRAYFFSPNGQYHFQDKLQFTQYEKNLKLFVQGSEQIIFATALGKIGIAICYDSEFPEIVRNLTLDGADIILVPSYTTTLAGYYRVSLSCRARAIENQCYVANAYVVNKVNLSGEIENTNGQAAIYSPADRGFPDDGIVTEGILNEPSLIVGEISIDALNKARTNGQVHNFEDSREYRQMTKNTLKMNQLF